ncbi:MAG: group II intron reverse transcriptase/maturase, partial [Bacteroidetes bacterium]|nr:group II intron reverse transcriptase/maturase [Bacteroidota bacterium]
SPVAEKRIAAEWKKMKFHKWTGADIQQIANEFNPKIKGIIQYYGRFKKWKLERLLRNFHFRLVKWLLNRYKRFAKSYKKAYSWLRKVRKDFPNLFYHWQLGYKAM